MKKEYKIVLLEGDGIGPEMTAEVARLFDFLSEKQDVKFNYKIMPFGASSFFVTGSSFPLATQQACENADAIFKGPIGLSFEDTKEIPLEERPERGALLPLRKKLQTYANFRPVLLPAELSHFSPLKKEVVGNGIDLLMIRELVGGLYFGEKKRGVDSNGKRWVTEELNYTEDQIRNIQITALQAASQRRKKLCNIHKSNVLLSSIVWNEILEETAKDFPDVEVEHMLVDAAATALSLKPGSFDVMVMENMFGDILSDQAGGILGSLGLMPSACMGKTQAYYEPSHGSAPDIAGKGIANPYSSIASIAMMLRMSFNMPREADLVQKAILSVFASGVTTPDLGAFSNKQLKQVTTREFCDQMLANLAKELS